MLEFIIILMITLIILYPIAVIVSHNATNGEEWINENVRHCPYKYKWQMADSLSRIDKTFKFTYLLTLPKHVVKDLWVHQVTLRRIAKDAGLT